MNTFNNEISGWAEEHGITLNDNYEAYGGDYPHEVLDSIYRRLTDFDSDEHNPMPGVMAGNVIEVEFGQAPEDYYPFCINDVLKLINNNSEDEWKLDKLDTEDDWMTADVFLSEKSGKEVQLKIKYVNQEGSLSANFSVAIEEFAAKNCALSVVFFHIDFFYRVFAFQHDAAEQFNELIEENSEPYPY